MTAPFLSPLLDKFNGFVELHVKRPGIIQIYAPLYHEDGDMVDIFVDEGPTPEGLVRISDYGMTLMRLSYSFEIDTPNKRRVFERLLTENRIRDNNGILFLDVDQSAIYPGILQFTQAVAKISSLRILRRELVASLFYEYLDDFVESELAAYRPQAKATPIASRDDLEVDYAFYLRRRPIYLFGVRDETKARLATISCLEFQRAKLNFLSLVVHEDFDHLRRNDRIRITSAADKQFVDLDDFKKNAEQVFARETA